MLSISRAQSAGQTLHQEDFVIFKSLSAASQGGLGGHSEDNPEAELRLVATNVPNGRIKIAPRKSARENPFPNK